MDERKDEIEEVKTTKSDGFEIKEIRTKDGRKSVEIKIPPAQITVQASILETIALVANRSLEQLPLPKNIQLVKDIVTKNVFNNLFKDITEKFIKHSGIKTKVSVKTLSDKAGEIKNLTSFDYAVFCAVATCYVDKVSTFSTARILKLITGNPNAKLTKKAEKEIAESIKKMRRTEITIDFTAEAIRLRLLSNDLTTNTTGFLIPAFETSVFYKGNRINRAYTLHTAPPLLFYALLKKHVVNVPLEIIDIPNLKKTKKTISLIHYLLTRILEISENQKLENLISLKKVYDVVEAKNAVERERVRKMVEKILQYWCKKEAFGLRDFTFVKYKRSFGAIEVNLVNRGRRR